MVDAGCSCSGRHYRQHFLGVPLQLCWTHPRHRREVSPVFRPAFGDLGQVRSWNTT
jgi:hypothetical protein